MANQSLRILVKEALVYFKGMNINLYKIIESNANEYAYAIRGPKKEVKPRNYVVPKELASRLAKSIKEELFNGANNYTTRRIEEKFLQRHAQTAGTVAVKYLEDRIQENHEDYKSLAVFVEEIIS